ncbi:MAG: 2'-5' RNA ligase family protein [Cohaesibacter sp.]|nr:2'-5' RNA ligase family protein [Cohaesibacter sp.]
MHSLWLTFDGPSQALLDQEIQRHAKAFDGPVFQPHLTLVGEIDWPLQKIQSICHQMVSDMETALPDTFPIKAIGSGQGYFMSLFLSLACPQPWQNLREQLAANLSDQPLKIDEAHVSVAYGLDKARIHPALLDEMSERLVGQTLKAGTIDLVRSSRQIPIEDWKILQSFSLPSK